MKESINEPQSIGEYKNKNELLLNQNITLKNNFDIILAENNDIKNQNFNLIQENDNLNIST